MPEIDDNNSGWPTWSRHVLSELKRLDKKIDSIDDNVRKIQIDLSSLKAKASFWGATAGAIVVLVAAVIAVIAELSAK